MKTTFVCVIRPDNGDKKRYMYMFSYKEMIDSATIPPEYFNKKKFDPFDINGRYKETDFNPNID